MTLLDIIEVYNLNNGKDLNDITAIFEDIELDNRLDKETLAGVLLDECGAMTSIYNVTSTFKYFSNLFFKKYAWNITKLVDTLEFQYDPLKNRRLDWTETSDIQQNLVTDEDVSESRTKGNTGTQTNTLDETVAGSYTDRMEDNITETDEKSYSETVQGSKNETVQGNNSETENTDFDSTETNTISAMNSSSYEPDTQRTTNSGTDRTLTGSDSKTTTGSDSKSTSGSEDTDITKEDIKSTTGSDTKDTDATSVRTDNLTETIAASTGRDKNEDLDWDETDTHEESGTVNTDYQTLIEKERKVAQFSIYGWIAKKYAKELFLLVY